MVGKETWPNAGLVEIIRFQWRASGSVPAIAGFAIAGGEKGCAFYEGLKFFAGDLRAERLRITKLEPEADVRNRRTKFTARISICNEGHVRQGRRCYFLMSS